jgi:hypothetical protein
MLYAAARQHGLHGVDVLYRLRRTPQERCEPHFVGRHIDDGEAILFRRFERFALPQDLLNANGTVGIRAPTDGDRVGCGPEVPYSRPTIPDGTDLPVG